MRLLHLPQCNLQLRKQKLFTCVVANIALMVLFAMAVIANCNLQKMPLELIEDLPLTYRLRTAKGLVKGLVILLHGVGSNESSMVPLASQLPEDIHVAMVRSPITIGPSAYCAFPVSFTANGPTIDAKVAEESRQLLSVFIPKLQARLGIVPAKTIIAGFSQGGC